MIKQKKLYQSTLRVGISAFVFLCIKTEENYFSEILKKCQIMVSFWKHIQ